MAVLVWPSYGTDRAFWPASIELQQVHLNRQLESDLSGDIQTASTPGSRWGWVMNFPRQTWAERARLMAFLTRLNGKQHRIALFDPHLPRPAGTVNLTGVTVQAAAAQFATALTLAGCTPGTTLVTGDWIKVGTQVLQVVVGGIANSGGLMPIEVRHLLRAAAAAGAAVTLDQPTGLYILAESTLGTQYEPALAREMTIELREVFS